jgi:hypothetical protein
MHSSAGPFEVNPGDMRVRVGSTDLYTYPDVGVTRDPASWRITSPTLF